MNNDIDECLIHLANFNLICETNVENVIDNDEITVEFVTLLEKKIVESG